MQRDVEEVLTEHTGTLGVMSDTGCVYCSPVHSRHGNQPTSHGLREAAERCKHHSCNKRGEAEA